ncbi:MAG: putative lipid II flippase FtsW [Gammaproteobacteria bacterium]
MSASGRSSKAKRWHFDSPLLIASASLLLIGFVMVTSSSLHLGVRQGETFLHYPIRQFVHIAAGLIVGALIMMIPVSKWEKAGPWLLAVGVILLTVVLIPGLGVKVKGSTRWLTIAGIRIQVSEAVKFFAVIYMAGYVSRRQKRLQTSAMGLIAPLGLFAVVSLLLLMEPDLGSAVVILLIVIGMLFLAGARLSILFPLGVVGVIAFALLVYLEPYRMKRITGFLDPWADPLGTGFQLVQALISFGRGEWLGVGLGSGIQKLFYLPEAHTDFLFSVIAEELGLLGVVTVIGLFALFFWSTFEIAVKAEKADQLFAAFIAYGLGLWFGFQSFVNMGVNMGILPTKGLTLPLMSYGGGSMIVMCAAVALLFRVHTEIAEIHASTPKGKSKWQNA